MTASRRALRRIALATIAALAATMTLASTPALALLVHQYLFQFNEIPASSGAAVPGMMYSPHMTVDHGHLWTAEFGFGRERVDEFDAGTGEFLAQPVYNSASTEYLNVAAHREAGASESQLYVTEYTEGVPSVGVYSEAGVQLASWTGAGTPSKFNTFALFGVAADNSTAPGDWAAGDVYVTVLEEKVVDVFQPQAGGGYAENYVTHLTGTCATPTACTSERFNEPDRVAVSSVNGDVYVLDENVVDEFEPTVLGEYVFVRKITGTPSGPFTDAFNLTVGGEGDLYVVDNREGGESPVVDQFDPGGFYLGAITGTSSGLFPATTGIIESVATDPSSGDVYVADYYVDSSKHPRQYVDVFGPSVVVPDVTTGPASDVTPEGALWTGTVNPDRAGVVRCWFAYGTSPGSLGGRVPCSSEVPEGEAAVPVEASAELLPDTTYYFRLEAENANGVNEGDAAQTQEVHTPGPGIHSEYVSGVSATAVSFGGRIDPDGAPTSYYFQYASSSTAGCGVAGCVTVPAAPGVVIGAGHGDVSLAPEYVEGLSPGSTYHYRLVAVSELGGEAVVFFGADRTFTTQTAPVGSRLLDGRSWEMVSPPDKHGALLISTGNEGVIEAAAAGGALTYLSSSPTEAEPQGYTNLFDSQIFATRTGSGWSSQDVSIAYEAPTSQEIGTGVDYRFFSEDLSLGVVQPLGGFVPASSPQALAPAEASEQTPFLRSDYAAGGPAGQCVQSPQHSCYRPLVTGMPGFANVPEGTRFGVGEEGECPPGILCGPQFVGASPDGRHIVLESEGVPLKPGVPAKELYEWSEGRLVLVSVLPETGEPAEGSNLGGNKYREPVRDAVSGDGSRVIWSAGNAKPLYVRDTVRGETVQVGGADAEYQDASRDASKIFYLEAGELFDCELVEVGGKLACRTSDLTPSSAGASAGVLGVIGVSRDGAWVYYVANGVLAEGATPGGCNGEPSSLCDVYVFHEGATQLVAIVTQADIKSSVGGNLRGVTMRVSPDGRWLAFMSSRELTGYDNRDAVSGEPDEELYLYHAPSALAGEHGSVLCASCDPTGARPVGVEYSEELEVSEDGLVGGNKLWKDGQWVAASVPGWEPQSLGQALYQPRYLSDSGRVFFNSPDALVPRDINGGWDVYEYEPVGVGSCSTASVQFAERSDGCIGLVSSGEAAGESAFLDASEGGGEVFFLTAGKLAPEDYDTSLDVYDAHECTESSPCLPVPPSTPPACGTSESCRGASAPQPSTFGAPASATFSGSGNLTPAKPKHSKASSAGRRLRRALARCRRRYRHRVRRRRRCERRVRRRLGGRASRHRRAHGAKRRPR